MMTKDWLTYPRILVLVLGLAIAGALVWMLPGWIQGKESKQWWEYVIILLLVAWSIILLFVGLFGSNQKVDKWGDWSTTHEASLIVMIVA